MKLLHPKSCFSSDSFQQLWQSYFYRHEPQKTSTVYGSIKTAPVSALPFLKLGTMFHELDTLTYSSQSFKNKLEVSGFQPPIARILAPLFHFTRGKCLRACYIPQSELILPLRWAYAVELIARLRIPSPPAKITEVSKLRAAKFLLN